jgi:hypothetical protein
VIDEAQFDEKEWASSEFGHLDGVEEQPPNMPEPRGQGFLIRAKFNADLATDSVTRTSRTGILVWINSCLVLLLERKANFFGSSFGSELVAMKPQDDGDPSECHLLYLWRQSVSAGKHDSARFRAEEEFTENCIPLCP